MFSMPQEKSDNKYNYTFPRTLEEFEGVHSQPPLGYYWAIARGVPKESECTQVVNEMVRQSSHLINRELYAGEQSFDVGEYFEERNEDLYYATIFSLYRIYHKKLNQV